MGDREWEWEWGMGNGNEVSMGGGKSVGRLKCLKSPILRCLIAPLLTIQQLCGILQKVRIFEI